MRGVLLPILSLMVLTAGASQAAASPDKGASASSRVVGLRRLTQDEYRNSITDIFGPGIEIRGVFEPTIRVGGLEAASTAVLSVTPAGFESYTKMADSIADQVTSEKFRARLACKPAAPNTADDDCARRLLEHYGLLLFRRPLTNDELQSRVALAHALAGQQKDFYAGLPGAGLSVPQGPGGARRHGRLYAGAL